MNEFLQFFENMPIWLKAVWITGIMALFWILEGYYAMFNLQYNKWRHGKVNIIFLVFVMLINIGFGILNAGVFEWMQINEFGLLFLIELPFWVELLLSVLLLDLLAQYFVHFLLHKVKWLWRLHIIHHSDRHVDVTTGTRHHPIDFIIRESFALIAILIFGMPLAFYLFYRIVTIFFTYFTHANINLPNRLDKTISLIFVSPKMHKFHHHDKMPWTDRNYGNMFSIWDRLFGTFVYGNPKKINYGIDALENFPDEDIMVQLGIPFNKKVKTRR